MDVVGEAVAGVDVEVLRTSLSDVLRMTGCACIGGEAKSRSLAPLGMTILAGCEFCAATDFIAAGLTLAQAGVPVLPPHASWGFERCIWSRTFWLEAATRWVKKVEPMPIQRVSSAMVTRIPI